MICYNKNFCVYKITNLINDKVYIGKTSSNPYKRWKEHVNVALNIRKYQRRYIIHNAICKYGVDNFSFEILEFF